MVLGAALVYGCMYIYPPSTWRSQSPGLRFPSRSSPLFLQTSAVSSEKKGRERKMKDVVGQLLYSTKRKDKRFAVGLAKGFAILNRDCRVLLLPFLFWHLTSSSYDVQKEIKASSLSGFKFSAPLWNPESPFRAHETKSNFSRQLPRSPFVWKCF